MFRNIYIEAYKTSIQQNSTLEMMLIHVNHMYAGMGCILQDIQFMVGNLLTHMKNAKGVTDKSNAKYEGRISIPEELEKMDDFSFKAPKFQFLPSSSMKCDNFGLFKHRNYEPQQVRTHKIQESVGKRNDSFEQMFPNTKQTETRTIQTTFDRNNRKQQTNSNSISVQKKTLNEVPPESQQDFIDYLFKKNKH